MCQNEYKKCAVNPGNRRWNQPRRSVISCLGINSLVSLHFRVRIQRRAVVWGGVKLHEERHLIRRISCDGNSWSCARFCLWIKGGKKILLKHCFCLVHTSHNQDRSSFILCWKESYCLTCLVILLSKNQQHHGVLWRDFSVAGECASFEII